MRYWIDTEFIEKGPQYPIELISVGIVAEDGRSYYAQSHEVKLGNFTSWLLHNVYPKLEHLDCWARLWSHEEHDCPWKSRTRIAKDIINFVGDDPSPEFWGYYADYDWVVFCQIFGTMMDLPNRFPMYCRDLIQEISEEGVILREECKTYTGEHHAGMDAAWTAAVGEAYMTSINSDKYFVSLSQRDISEAYKKALADLPNLAYRIEAFDDLPNLGEGVQPSDTPTGGLHP